MAGPRARCTPATRRGACGPGVHSRGRDATRRHRQPPSAGPGPARILQRSQPWCIMLAAVAQPITILFLGANPSNTTRLALDRELREIKQRLRLSEHRKAFRIEQDWAVRAADLQDSLRLHRPTIVHFSGHGSRTGEILLEDGAGQTAAVATDALGELFRMAQGDVRCVVLNACYSETQAKSIAHHIDCVVGMTSAVEDSAAIAFAGAFYQTLGYGDDVQRAFDSGKVQIALTRSQSDAGRAQSARRDVVLDEQPEAGPTQAEVPRLITRNGVRASDIRLATNRQVLGRSRHPDVYLCCGRTEAWIYLQGAVRVARAHVVLLCGSDDAGHYYFLRRIRSFGESQLEAKIVKVESNIFDWSAASIGSLGDALEVDADGVADAVARITEDRPLVLLYPEAYATERADWLTAHHAKAIPEIFDQVAQRHGGRAKNALIAVQPLLWRRRLWDFLKPLSGHETAHRTVAELPSPLVHLAELNKIRSEHIEDFLREIYANDHEKADEKLNKAKLLRRQYASESKFLAALKDLVSTD
ncbi:CHAT domain-containing protein [Sorangium sp. So ce131]|uniref:CHAT domain-containing protein n=1 Tax=Sorangium sp. So ce131 TaxID=3133282 RepID=UPI003F625DD3